MIRTGFAENSHNIKYSRTRSKLPLSRRTPFAWNRSPKSPTGKLAPHTAFHFFSMLLLLFCCFGDLESHTKRNNQRNEQKPQSALDDGRAWVALPTAAHTASANKPMLLIEAMTKSALVLLKVIRFANNAMLEKPQLGTCIIFALPLRRGQHFCIHFATERWPRQWKSESQAASGRDNKSFCRKLCAQWTWVCHFCVVFRVPAKNFLRDDSNRQNSLEQKQSLIWSVKLDSVFQ